MSKSPNRDIRGFILSHVEKHSKDIAHFAAAKFQISRQAVNKHLQKLVAEGALRAEGNTRDRNYRIATIVDQVRQYKIAVDLAEDQAWSQDVVPLLGALPSNVIDIWQFCFTEIFNNAIDHSAGSTIDVNITKTAADTQITLRDDGVGIFKKIQKAMNLFSEHGALLELAKGKFTTDPQRHTGQGIFFASRLLDSFSILSGGVFFSHLSGGSHEDWVLEIREENAGTAVFMKLSDSSTRTCKEVFNQYSSGVDFGFTKTVIPVELAQYKGEKLISRSQAKRVLTRIDQFKSVCFDFDGIESVGQAFADEIFRVFARSHPEIELMIVNANTEVQQAAQAARSQLASEIGGI